MAEEVAQKKSFLHSNLFIILILFFLAVITYLLVSIAQGVTQQATSLQSQAAAPVAKSQSAEAPEFIEPSISCSNYKEELQFMRSMVKLLDSNLKCTDWITPSPGANSSPEFLPNNCEVVSILKRQIEDLNKFIGKVCLSCRTGDQNTSVGPDDPFPPGGGAQLPVEPSTTQ